MRNGLVSIIIPTRNRAVYLKKALDSVYAQTYQDFEIIVIDDGSGDATKDVAGHYDHRLRYFFQKQKGVSAARNEGFRMTEGEYVAFLDDDDLYVPEKLQRCIGCLSQNPQVVWVCSGFSFIDAEGQSIRSPIVPEKEKVTLHDIAMFAFIHTSSVVVRREILEQAGGFPERSKVSEDYHMWAKILAKGEGVALQETLTRFRQHKGNTKLPYWQLLKENTRIIDSILTAGAPDLRPRKVYMENLHRIISESLLYKRQYFQYACFRLQKIFHPAADS